MKQYTVKEINNETVEIALYENGKMLFLKNVLKRDLPGFQKGLERAGCELAFDMEEAEKEYKKAKERYNKAIQEYNKSIYIYSLAKQHPLLKEPEVKKEDSLLSLLERLFEENYNLIDNRKKYEKVSEDLKETNKKEESNLNKEKRTVITIPIYFLDGEE